MDALPIATASSAPVARIGPPVPIALMTGPEPSNPQMNMSLIRCALGWVAMNACSTPAQPSSAMQIATLMSG